MLWLNDVYEPVAAQPDRQRLQSSRAPTSAQLTQLANTVAHRVCWHLAGQGWLVGEDESVFLSDCAGCDDGLDALRMSSITYRIAAGKHAGRKVATLQTILADADAPEGDAGKVGGFSLHAGVTAEASKARSSNACAAPSRAGRSRKSGYCSRRRAGCVTRSRSCGETARRTWRSSRWDLSPSWRRWFRHRARTSPASTASSRQTRSCVRS